ncbi:MAG TPA: CBS domain-containing protein [Rhizomicrobium sp.]|nr:CBS domain-containing protein [Rhizomicrobium sp.]
MRVSEVMCRNARLVQANDTVQHAAKIMAQEGLGFLPVEEDDRLVGILTDRDIIIRCIAQGKGADARVRDALTRDVKYCFESDDLDDVMENMAEIQVRRLPVLSEDKRLVGIISLADAARMTSPDTVGVALSGVVAPGGYHSGDLGRA